MNEFQSIKSGNYDTISIQDFKDKYGEKLINRSRKSKEMIVQIENEQKMGFSDGLINFEEFSMMYLFLEFDDKKKQKKGQSSDH